MAAVYHMTPRPAPNSCPLKNNECMTPLILCVYIYIYIYIYIYVEFRCEIINAILNFLFKWAFLSCTYIYVQLFNFNCIEKDLHIAIIISLLNLNLAAG